MAPHSTILAWKIPWTEEPGRATVHRVTKSRTQLSMLAYGSTSSFSWTRHKIIFSGMKLIYFISKCEEAKTVASTDASHARSNLFIKLASNSGQIKCRERKPEQSWANLTSGQDAAWHKWHAKMWDSSYCNDDSQVLFSVQFSSSVVSNSLQPNGPQHARLPCPSPTPGAHSHSCPLTRWCRPTVSSSVIPFSSCLQSFPASGSFKNFFK